MTTELMFCKLTDELADYGPGALVVSLILGGPKLYACRCKKPYAYFGYTFKLKGIRFNYSNTQKIYFKSVSEMILNGSEIEIEGSAIRRNQFHDGPTLSVGKMVYDKSRYVGLTISYPYEFKTESETTDQGVIERQ